MTSNTLFSIPTPQLYRCHIHHYHSRISRLYIRCFKGAAAEPAFYLLFADVGYIDAPVNWQGVGFYQAADDHCLTLMAKLGLIDPAFLQDAETRAALAESAHLYLLDTPQTQIRIIAGAASKLDSVPPELSKG